MKFEYNGHFAEIGVKDTQHWFDYGVEGRVYLKSDLVTCTSEIMLLEDQNGWFTQNSPEPLMAETIKEIYIQIFKNKVNEITN